MSSPVINLRQCYNDICLLMIVKNEEPIITKTLKNVVSSIRINHFLICDTGSSDKTIETVMETMSKLNISGLVLNHKWKDFGYNRNLALSEARKRIPLVNSNGYETYVLMFDADDSIILDKNIDGIPLPDVMTADAYSLQFKTHLFSYNRPLLIRLASSWKYEGVVHEFLSDTSPRKTNRIIHIEGNYSITSGRCGNRNNNPDKYKNDALLLEKAICDTMTEQHLIPRYAFYCAQSWKDYCNREKAIEWYKNVITKYNNWSEEKYYASLKVGEMLRDDGKVEESLYYFLIASSFNNQRLECVTEASKILLDKKHYQSAHMILMPYIEKILTMTDVSPDWLFSTPLTYKCDTLLRLALSSYYTDDKGTLKRVVMEFLKRISTLWSKNNCDRSFSKCSFNHISSFLTGLEFYLDKIEIDRNSIDELIRLFELLKNALTSCLLITDLQTCHQWRKTFELKFTEIARRTKIVSDTIILRTCDSTRFRVMIGSNRNKCDENYYNVNNIEDDIENDVENEDEDEVIEDVILTMTTCKRLELFKKTVFSILECFSEDDFSRIIEWFVVDDGSSDEDVREMKSLFPFMTIIRKSSNQLESECKSDNDCDMTLNYPEGHRGSMNLIHKVLNELRPKYWLHIEDDWLFLKKGLPGGLIGSAINYLEHPEMVRQNVQQILFNKGYSETVGDVIVPCGEYLELNGNTIPGIKTHVKFENEVDFCIPTCNYWNHFSLRPGITRVSAILNIGDFNTPNTFFEADYATAFVEKGYKTAYFDDIICIHMGRLSGERGDIDTANAYTLNKKKQF